MKGVTVEVRLMKAEKLKPMNKAKGECDAYGKLKIERTGESYQTSVCYNTLLPRWYEAMEFSNIIETDILSVELWDNSLLGAHEIIGSIRIPIAIAFKGQDISDLNAAKQRALSKWFYLDNKNGKFSILFVAKKDGDSLSKAATAHNFIQFVNRKYRPRIEKSGLAKNAKGALDVISSFTRQIHPLLDLSLPVEHFLTAHSTYTVKLENINSIVKGVMQGWSRDYVAAQLIFSSSMSGSLKTALVTQHDIFYGKIGKSFSIDSVRKDLAQVNGAILDSEDLFQIINYGKRDGKSRLFTYVIIDNELRFCETGANFHKDIDSKHAMHSRASTEVIYAGEFLVKNEKLVVDNASGTYSPNPELLPKVKELLESNFFGLQVEVFDFNNEKLSEYKKSCIAE